MDSTPWLTIGRELCNLLCRIDYIKRAIQCRYGKSDLLYKRFVVFEREMDTLRVCLGKIMGVNPEDISIESTFYTCGDWTSPSDPVALRPLPKAFTDEQQTMFQELLADIRAYVDGLDIYAFSYHAQLRVYRNIVLLRINGLQV